MPLMDISTARVIEEVKRQPVLWNTSHQFYRSKLVRHKSWQKIFRALIPNFEKMPIAQQKDADKGIQQRWKTARDAYMRNKALIKSGAIVKKYFYYDLLSFLDKIGPGWYEPKTSSPSEESTASPNLKQLLVQVEPLSPSNTSTTSPPAQTPASPPPLSSDPLASTPHVNVTVKQEPCDETNIQNNDDFNDENSYDASNLHTEIDIEDEVVEEIPVEFLPSPGNSRPRKAMKRKLVGSEINVEVYKLLKKTSKDLKDDNMSFFMSMLPIVNKFSDRRKLLFRSEVIRIALELSSKDD